MAMISNPLRLELLVLPGELPTSAHIGARVLAERKACADLLTQARAEAERIQAGAVALLEQARQDAEAIRRTAYQQAAHDLDLHRHQAATDAAAKAVQWLCAEQDLELAIAREVSSRWRHLTAQALNETIARHDQTELLLHRIERKVGELLPHGQISLHVPPAALAAAQHCFAQTTQVVVVADAQLMEEQARLETHLLHVHIDLATLQRELLAQFAGKSPRQAYA